MSRKIKLLSAALAIAIAATIAAVVAYDKGRSDNGRAVRYELSLDSKPPIVIGTIGTPARSPSCRPATWQVAPCSHSAAPASSTGYTRARSEAQLVIRHVRNGCHVLSDGRLRATSLHLSLRRSPHLNGRLQRWSLRTSLTRDARLRVFNRDIVAQQLVQLAGPNLALRGHVMPGKTQLIRFDRSGVYRFTNAVVRMGTQRAPTTIGLDSTLRLTVRVR